MVRAIECCIEKKCGPIFSRDVEIGSWKISALSREDRVL